MLRSERAVGTMLCRRFQQRTSRAEMAAALHSARALRGAKTIREEIDLAVLIFHGTERHETLRLLQQGGMAILAKCGIYRLSSSSKRVR